MISDTTQCGRRGEWALVLYFLCAIASGCGDAQCEINVGSPLSVVSVAPSHGAIYVDPATEVIIAFSEALADDAGGHIELMDEETVIAATSSVQSEQKVVVLTPQEPLKDQTTYYIVIGAELAGAQSGPLGVELQYRFTTR